MKNHRKQQEIDYLIQELGLTEEPEAKEPEWFTDSYPEPDACELQLSLFV